MWGGGIRYYRIQFTSRLESNKRYFIVSPSEDNITLFSPRLCVHSEREGENERKQNRLTSLSHTSIFPPGGRRNV